MRKLTMFTISLGLAISLFASGQAVHAAGSGKRVAVSCSQLWYERNKIYARNGYCFQSARARARFGTRCRGLHISISQREWERVKRIRRLETGFACY